MPHRSAETATYPGEMAKFEFDIPEDLVDEIDRVAARTDETRNQFILRIAAEEIDRSHAKMRVAFEELWEKHPLDLGGRTAEELIREDRDHRDDKRFGPDPRVR